MTPTVDGIHVLLGDLRLTPAEAMALADRLNSASWAAVDAGRRQAEAAAEAAFRAEPGVVEYVDHLGQPAWGRLVEDGHEVRIRRPGATPAGLGYAGRWPETVRLRTHGGRIAHLWRGTGQALCRRWLRRPTFAPDDLRTCPACAAKEVARG